MKKDSAVSRRSFLKGTAATAAITLANGAAFKVFGQTTALTPGPGNKWPGRVVVNFNKNAVTMNGNTGTAAPDVIKSMVNESILSLTGQTSIGAAWKAIFPSSLTAQSKIAIKVPLGCATQKMAPHWSSVKAITDGLQQMDFNGTKFPGSNITIYDSKCQNKLSSYGYNSTNFGSQIKIVYDPYGKNYSDGAVDYQGNRYSSYAQTLNSHNFLINVFRPGGHSSWVEGFTLGFKNHYGTYPAHNSYGQQGGSSSFNMPYLRDINCTGAVYNKNVLSMCCGIFGAQEASGAPQSSDIPYYQYAHGIDNSITNTSYPPCTIIMSTDPVTAEMQTIKMMRVNKDKSYDVNSMPKYLQSSGGISCGLNKVYNIGIIDEKEMDIRRIINGEIIGVGVRPQWDENVKISSNSLTFALENNRFQPVTAGFSVPVGKSMSVRITDPAGSLIQEISSDFTQKLAWDGHTRNGRFVKPGLYLVTVSCGSFTQTKKISIATR